MNQVREILDKLFPLVAAAAATASWQTTALGQETQGEQPAEPAGQSSQSLPAGQNPEQPPMEEVVTIGRSLSLSQQVANERLQDASVVDTMGADTIERLGDSTVAASLRRLPGLSLVADKFVYIRGLGERYSSTTLNGADIPSPDLTRNVIPLDVFPTSVVESLRVQKAWSPDMSANFGGGAVDIRTRGIPAGLDINFELGTGTNTENSGKGLTYPGGSDDNLGTDDGTRALSPDILSALNEYQGNIDVQSIFTILRRADSTATFADAQAINRNLALKLNRNIGFQEKNLGPDRAVKFSVGDSFAPNDNWQFGILAGTTYDSGWRKTTRFSRNVNFPDERTDTVNESTHSVDLSGTVNMGLNFLEDHSISTTSLYLRNTDDRTAIEDFFNENGQISDGRGFRDYRIRYEERSLRTNQIKGSHYIGDATRRMFPKLTGWLDWLPTETNISWFYSDSKAATDIPNEVTVGATTITDPLTAEVLSAAVKQQSAAADYRFTNLDDTVRDSGWSITLPLERGRSTIELKGGGGSSEKARTYRQTQFSFGPRAVADISTLSGPLNAVFSDANVLNPANDFAFTRNNTNGQSYLAATKTDALFGLVDWTYNDKWRVTGGARWENYRQVAVDWDPYGYSESNPQVTTDPDKLAKGTFQSDDVFPSLDFTYMSKFWAETFQLRFGWSRTSVRPDLREITDASYIDPITQILTRGNSGVVPADVNNYDLRADWYFSSGDSFTVTLFNKDIDKPIEFFESPASDTTIAREIVNAASAQVKGIEIEGLKNLAFLGGFFEPFFLQGNLTLEDSELVAGPRADTPTNPVRPMAGASDYVLNFMIGYDSPNQKHTVSLIYNVFGERLYVAGRNGAPDGYEQPFNSLDMTYSWYPTDALTFKAKAQNILGDTIQIERAGIRTYEQDPGRNFALNVQWVF
jgi:TonB-dependent receptor